jgi:hypothetical protein
MTQIILTKPHNHAGVMHDIDTELDVFPGDAEWLVWTGVARFKQGVQRRSFKEFPPASEASPASGEPEADVPAMPAAS